MYGISLAGITVLHSCMHTKQLHEHGSKVSDRFSVQAVAGVSTNSHHICLCQVIVAFEAMKEQTSLLPYEKANHWIMLKSLTSGIIEEWSTLGGMNKH